MKKHLLVALYAIIFAGAISTYFWQVRGLGLGWALLTSLLWQAASLGLYLEKKWAAAYSFGLFGFALVMTLGYGLVLIVTGTDFTLPGGVTYFSICLSLFLPMKTLSSKEVKKTFGLRVDDTHPENQLTKNEKA